MKYTTGHIQKELLMIEYSQAKAPTLLKSIDDKVRQLYSDIEQLKQADGNQYREQLKAAEQGPLFLSGHYVKLIIGGGNVILITNYSFIVIAALKYLIKPTIAK